MRVLAIVIPLFCFAVVPLVGQGTGRPTVQVIREYWDVSGSLDDQAASGLKSDLTDIEQLFRTLHAVQRWEVHEWASLSDLLASKARKIKIPIRERVECEEASGEGAFLRSIKKQADQQCSKRVAAAEQKFKDSLRKPIGDVVSVRQSLNVKQQAQQTCFWHLIGYLLKQSSGSVNIVVTDGVDENCGAAPSRQERMGTDTTIIVLLPAKSDLSGQTNPVERTEMLRHKLPDVPVIWRSEVDPSWKWLLRALGIPASR